jgi:hypothetical protein
VLVQVECAHSDSSLSPSSLNIEVETMGIELFNKLGLSVNIALIATLPPSMVMTADAAGRVRSFVIARQHPT